MLAHSHDIYATNYGQYPSSPSGPNPCLVDPLQLVHEREYLERIVQQTSENLIDIFAPPMLTAAPASITPTTRADWYRTLLERTSPPRDTIEMPVVLDPKIVGNDEREWLSRLVHGGELAVKDLAKVKEVGALVVGLESL